ncbi:polysaccharide deacetylase [Trinickia symbiotica]|uniref:Polysaccharide deacetylase n=1 Tax=Trinickia symbiotica TaxID=863227 RepID=A0A2N7X573_9BURK|nr:polysaccharide deacetylase family protein [Trinickia symbiotica]PMS36903.1 polysaccharide deacetylase [Trinickia symbiotica]PPK45310.1 polysaccharide deacetylase [Trinickia symbiotica]
MIDVLFSHQSAEAGKIVLAALRRSVSAIQARHIARCDVRAGSVAVLAAVDIPNEDGQLLVEWLRAKSDSNAAKGKLIVFGRLPDALAKLLECRPCALPDNFGNAARSAVALSGHTAASRADVRYDALSARLGEGTWVRPFERFDFTDEWNNLGFGAVRADGSIWSVRDPIDVPNHARLASVYVDGERRFSYAALWDLESASVLWFNRPVGPCDSFEWRTVENFLSGHRGGELPCQPILSEIPWGFDAAVTSRLDCDEDVESARPLWETYRSLGVPFSLAVHTSNLRESVHHALLQELAAAPHAAILSHTATHAPNWGGSYEAAFEEGRESARAIEAVTAKPVRYAVSPFHQSPRYALEALADAGYAGCIGGIIRNDPEFLLARAGALAEMQDGFIGHSQQCMLHGDCMLADGDPLSVFKQAFDFAYETNTFFGYLDHPFSPRYQYGWRTEEQRIRAHEELIAYIRRRASRPLFLDEVSAMDFLRAKSLSCVVEADGSYLLQPSRQAATDLSLAVEYRGERIKMTSDGRLK